MKLIHYLAAFFLLSRDIWYLKERVGKNRSYLIAYYAKLKFLGSYIGNTCQLDDVPFFPHGLKSIFISGEAHIGKNCVIYQQVTIGSNTLADSKHRGAPDIGDNCLIGAGAQIIGNVKIGNNCRIGAGAVVVEDVPENSLVVAQKPRIIHRIDMMDNRVVAWQDGKAVRWENGKWEALDDE